MHPRLTSLPGTAFCSGTAKSRGGFSLRRRQELRSIPASDRLRFEGFGVWGAVNEAQTVRRGLRFQRSFSKAARSSRASENSPSSIPAKTCMVPCVGVPCLAGHLSSKKRELGPSLLARPGGWALPKQPVTCNALKTCRCAPHNLAPKAQHRRASPRPQRHNLIPPTPPKQQQGDDSMVGPM